MKLKLKIFIITLGIIFSLSNVLSAQVKASIENMPLRWTNFTKKETSLSSVMKAATVANIKLEFSTTEDPDKINLTINLNLVHDDKASWVSKGFLRRSSDAETNDLLLHERIHYAINYLSMKRMYDRLSAATYTKDYKAEVSLIFQEMNMENELRQIKYDSETLHSVRKEEQEQWHTMINEELASTFGTLDAMKNSYKITKVIYK